MAFRLFIKFFGRICIWKIPVMIGTKPKQIFLERRKFFVFRKWRQNKSLFINMLVGKVGNFYNQYLAFIGCKRKWFEKRIFKTAETVTENYFPGANVFVLN